ncbi:hypothetical protein CR513_51959, partial [Mucuna pruriens]
MVGLDVPLELIRITQESSKKAYEGCVEARNKLKLLGKFDSKVDKGIFLEYLDTFKIYKNLSSKHVKFNDGLTNNRRLSNLEDDFADFPYLQIGSSNKTTNKTRLGDAYESSNAKAKLVQQTKPLVGQPHRDWKFVICHPQYLILGERTKGVKTKSSFKNQASYTLVYETEPKNIEEALKDDDWIIAMEEELH